jgi:hypothetical protein
VPGYARHNASDLVLDTRRLELLFVVLVTISLAETLKLKNKCTDFLHMGYDWLGATCKAPLIELLEKKI